MSGTDMQEVMRILIEKYHFMRGSAGLNDRNHECDATDEMYFGGWFEEEN